MSQASQVAMPHPIQVNACNPERNISYNYAGYTPGFYPSYGLYGRYWGWPSVYGPTYYQAPVENDPTLGIDYVNVTHVVMKQIEFGLLVRGAWSPRSRTSERSRRARRSSTSSASVRNVFPLQTSYAKCVPLKITFEDGSQWKNPHLPAYRASMYGTPPH